jgi:lipoprotein NlpI
MYNHTKAALAAFLSIIPVSASRADETQAAASSSVQAAGSCAFDCPARRISYDPGGAIGSSVYSTEIDLKVFEAGRIGVTDPAGRDLDRAIARYGEKLMLDPKDDNAYFRRGIANLYAGSFAGALTDINKARELDPQYPYYELWLHIVDRRGNLPSSLAQAAPRFDMTKWPAPIIRLFLGQTTSPAVLAAAADTDTDTQRGQLCEANFYIGQLHLEQHATKEAARLFRLAAMDCPRGFVEGPAASAELTALVRTP